jgi:hypothetical protein
MAVVCRLLVVWLRAFFFTICPHPLIFVLISGFFLRYFVAAPTYVLMWPIGCSWSPDGGKTIHGSRYDHCSW